MAKVKGMTFRDLKKAIEALSDEQLDNEVIWWGDQRGGEIDSLFVLPEEYVSIDGEGMYPISGYREGFKPEDYAVASWEEFVKNHVDASMKAGTPVLCADDA